MTQQKANYYTINISDAINTNVTKTPIPDQV